MSDPVVDPADLALYLNDDDSINTPRAELMIRHAQTACETYLSVEQCPQGADWIVTRVAHRGYISITASRQYQLDMADAEYGTPGGVGGIYLTPKDKADLDDFRGTNGTRTVYSVPFDPPWNTVDLLR